ncbi:hypothetical protein [Fervidibacter sacchari]
MKKKLLFEGVAFILGMLLAALLITLYQQAKEQQKKQDNRHPAVAPQPQKTQRQLQTQVPVYQQQVVPAFTNRLVCPACQGRGFFSDPIVCPICYGAGKVIAVRCIGYAGGIPVYQRDQTPTTCPHCGGYGFLLPTTGRCETCGGKTLSEYFNQWQMQAKQAWLAMTGGRYAEINATP